MRRGNWHSAKEAIQIWVSIKLYGIMGNNRNNQQINVVVERLPLEEIGMTGLGVDLALKIRSETSKIETWSS
jgi:hypothetical protein